VATLALDPQNLPAMTGLANASRTSDNPTFNAQIQRILDGLRKAGLPEGEQKTN
jgi:hypothetical protein